MQFMAVTGGATSRLSALQSKALTIYIMSWILWQLRQLHCLLHHWRQLRILDFDLKEASKSKHIVY